MNNDSSEIIFEVREAEEGGYWARALGADIFTQGEDWEDLKAMVKDAVELYFDNPETRPKVVRLMLMTTKEEVIPLHSIRASA
ncbi:MAG: 2-oxoisovalerate dehydrogenase [bacterium]|nr:2-oxoisovalerate dehydrogenase [bacterium]